MILSESEFERREQALSTTHKDHDLGEQMDVNDLEEYPSPTIPFNNYDNFGDDVGDDDHDNEVVEKLIDDVYDENAVKPHYELQTLRKYGILNYMEIMEMTY
jgi:hypothetical protein